MAAVHEITLPVKLTTTAIVGPGEKLIVGISEPISHAQHARMQDTLTKALPGVQVVVIDRCSGLAVYRDDQPEDGSKPDMSDEEFATRLRKWIRIHPDEFQQWIDKYNRVHYGTTVR